MINPTGRQNKKIPGIVWPTTLVDENLIKNSKSGIILPMIKADNGNPSFFKGITAAG